MPLRAVSADKLPYQPRAPSAPEPDVDLSIYGVTVPVKRPGRLYQSTDYGAEVEDEWKDVEKATSEDKEQVRSMWWSDKQGAYLPHSCSARSLRK